LRDLLDLKGASGRVYRFMLLREGRPLSPMGGNYAYVRDPEGDCEVIFTDEAQNLLTEAKKRWTDAVQMHGEMHLYTRLNISERIRLQEHADLMEALNPPMNGRDTRQKKA
jgi:hypothetical protein